MRTISKLISIIASLSVLFSCNNENINSESQAQFFNRTNFIDLTIKDKAGNNLLFHKTPNCITEKDITVFYKNGNSELVAIYNPNLTHSRGYVFSENEIRLYLMLPDKNKSVSYTFIKFKNNLIFEFKSEFCVNENNISLKNIWFENAPIWNEKDGLLKAEIVLPDF